MHLSLRRRCTAAIGLVLAAAVATLTPSVAEARRSEERTEETRREKHRDEKRSDRREKDRDEKRPDRRDKDRDEKRADRREKDRDEKRADRREKDHDGKRADRREKDRDEKRADRREKDRDEKRADRREKDRDERRSDRREKDRDERRSDRREKDRDERRSDRREKDRDEKRADRREKDRDEKRADRREKDRDEKRDDRRARVAAAESAPRETHEGSRRTAARHDEARATPAVLALPLTASTATIFPPSATALAPPQGRAGRENLLSQVPEMPALVASARWSPQRGAYTSRKADGREVELTLDHDLQEQVRQMLSRYDVPYASVVAIDPRDGRILSLAETGTERVDAASARFPAASVFKIVTGAALLEAGIPAETEVCFHGGARSIGMSELRDNPALDHRCESLSTAMGKSLNVVFGKLASRSLDAGALRDMASRFFFTDAPASTSSMSPVAASRAYIPDDALGFGRTAAGFGKVFLSPVHGAMLAGAVGNHGMAVEPHLVKGVGPRSQRVVSESTSAELARMMQRTVTEGTARKAFRAEGRSVLNGVTVAGKTGSLSDHAPLPFKDYSWFVGFAPAENPRIAVAAVVVNGLKWKVKAPVLARETLAAHFDRRPAGESH